MVRWAKAGGVSLRRRLRHSFVFARASLLVRDGDALFPIGNSKEICGMDGIGPLMDAPINDEHLSKITRLSPRVGVL